MRKIILTALLIGLIGCTDESLEDDCGCEMTLSRYKWVRLGTSNISQLQLVEISREAVPCETPKKWSDGSDYWKINCK